MRFKFEILIFGQQMRMDINDFEFIYLPIMNEFLLMICLIQVVNEIHHNKSFIYGHIHLYRWIIMTLNFKFQAQALRSCTSYPPFFLVFVCCHCPTLHVISLVCTYCHHSPFCIFLVICAYCHCPPFCVFLGLRFDAIEGCS
jgi:hypothetical protein